MFDPEILKISSKLIARYGVGVEALKCIEEMAELTQAIAKASCDGDSTTMQSQAFERLLEETADVFITVHHLVNICGADLVQAEVDKKLWKAKAALYKT